MRTGNAADMRMGKKDNFKFKKGKKYYQRTATREEAPAQENTPKQRIAELMWTAEDTPAQENTLKRMIAEIMAKTE